MTNNVPVVILRRAGAVFREQRFSWCHVQSVHFLHSADVLCTPSLGVGESAEIPVARKQVSSSLHQRHVKLWCITVNKQFAKQSYHLRS